MERFERSRNSGRPLANVLILDSIVPNIGYCMLALTNASHYAIISLQKYATLNLIYTNQKFAAAGY